MGFRNVHIVEEGSMKVRISLLLVVLLIFTTTSLFAGGGQQAAAAVLKAGMVTDAGTIDDKSFNQGTWEGVLRAGRELKVDTKYLKPSGTTEADYLKEIGNLYDAGYKFMVTPGFKFETTIFQAQNRYKDAKFVLIDGSPHAGDWASVVGPNTVSIFFAEHESGFLAGVAAAVELKSGSFGFIGGMEIPPVQKFNWGFQRGVDYANKNLGTKVEMKAENVIYQGSFDNVAAGQQIAASMFDKGVNVIFAAAGGVGVGAINEAKARGSAGRTAWIVGVDVDQYAEGIYSGNKSIILTSAMKRIDNAAFDMIKAEIDGKFPGGQTLNFDVKNDGVGIPASNPNLSADTQAKVLDVYKKMQSGAIVVPADQGSFIK
jgi:basic membrane protein A